MVPLKRKRLTGLLALSEFTAKVDVEAWRRYLATFSGAVTQLTFSLHLTEEVLFMMTKKYKHKFFF